MKKLTLTIIFILFLAACNYPQQTDPSQDPVVQTRVAVLLTQGAETAVEETQTVEAPVEQELITPYPVEETAIQQPATPQQPTQLTTVPPTTTPELSEEPWSGTPDFQEDFDQTRWDFENDYLLSKVVNGQLEFTSKGTAWWSSWYTVRPEQENGYFETTFTMPNCSGPDRFGLVIRWSSDNDFYYIGVTCESTWGFTYYTSNNQSVDLVSYSNTTALNPPHESNRIGILAEDDSFEFYINGQMVGSISHDAVDGEGTFGFVTRSSGTTDFKTVISELKYWSLD